MLSVCVSLSVCVAAQMAAQASRSHNRFVTVCPWQRSVS